VDFVVRLDAQSSSPGRRNLHGVFCTLIESRGIDMPEVSTKAQVDRAVSNLRDAEEYR
jgi:hypothetical protein